MKREWLTTIEFGEKARNKNEVNWYFTTEDYLYLLSMKESNHNYKANLLFEYKKVLNLSL